MLIVMFESINDAVNGLESPVQSSQFAANIFLPGCCHWLLWGRHRTDVPELLYVIQSPICGYQFGRQGRLTLVIQQLFYALRIVRDYHWLIPKC